MNKLLKLQIKEIIPNKNQPRLDFDDETIVGLAESIKQNGLLQPITVRKNGNKYEIIAGERRFRACKLNGFKEIDAILVSKSDDESASLALVENIQREDLNAVEQALAMKKLMKLEDLTQSELATKLGYKQSTVANKIRLLKLPKYILNAVSNQTITERHARALLNVPKEKLEDTYLTIVNKKYNVAKTEEYIRGLLVKKKERGFSANAKLAVNTFKQAYDMCRKSGIDADYKTRETGDEVKITITIKK